LYADKRLFFLQTNLELMEVIRTVVILGEESLSGAQVSAIEDKQNTHRRAFVELTERVAEISGDKPAWDVIEKIKKINRPVAIYVADTAPVSPVFRKNLNMAASMDLNVHLYDLGPENEWHRTV